MIWIGIDCGDNTGLAIWDAVARDFRAVATMPIHRAMEAVLNWNEVNDGDIHVIFEDARLRRWFPRERNASEYRGRLMGAGAVKRDATIWEDFLKDKGIPYTAQAPHQGMTKWNAEQFARVTGWKGRTSEHARDAAMLVFQRENRRPL